MHKRDIPRISETTIPINMKILDNVSITKICYRVQYYNTKKFKMAEGCQFENCYIVISQ